MQVVVLVVQNSVPVDQIGTATSSNNYFREVGAALGVAIFGAAPEAAAQSTATLDPQTLNQLPAGFKDGIVQAYADSLAPVFWYLVPFLVIALVLALTLKEIPLSDVAGMVARGEAIGGEEADRLEAEPSGTLNP